MSNYHLRDKNISLKAKGLLSWMLSNNEDWDYSINGIVACCKENETAIKSALDELKNAGYLVVNKLMPETKDGIVIRSRIEYEYIVYEEPIQPRENLCVEFQCVEDQVQINTKQTNTKKEKVISKDITTNPSTSFQFGKPKTTKPNLYQQCISLIEDKIPESYGNVRKLLKDYLDLRLEMRDKTLYVNQWKGMLDKLLELHKQGYAYESIIRQSIDRGYASFYPINNYRQSSVDNIDAPQAKFDPNNLAKDENGNLMKF
jgi:hypothetical protein